MWEAITSSGFPIIDNSSSRDTLRSIPMRRNDSFHIAQYESTASQRVPSMSNIMLSKSVCVLILSLV